MTQRLASISLALLVSFMNLRRVAYSADEFLRSFTPTPSAAARRYHMTGVLGDFGEGMRSGSVTVAVDGRARRFYLTSWHRLLIDGRVFPCVAPPRSEFRGADCADWPRSLVIGKSVVTVEYFFATYFDGTRVPVVDRIGST